MSLFDKKYFKHIDWMTVAIVLGLVAFGTIALASVMAVPFDGTEASLSDYMSRFNMEYLIRDVCIPLAIIMATIIVGRFLWRICFFGSAVKIETDLRSRMFEHARLLSNQYYQVNKVGNLMSLFTNDLDTIQE